MRRLLYKQLLQWKEKENRKPLILNGARQVGKTYLLQEFGKAEYDKLAFFSLDRDRKAVEIFEKGGSTADILLALSAVGGVDITPGDTLIVFDEIQDCPKALEMLKFFCEERPDLHIVVAGSLLGLSLHDGTSYPVGKVEELRLYPMTFLEFLDAMGKTQLVNLLENCRWSVIGMLETEFISLLRQYYYVGGMPAAVLAHVNQKGLQAVRRIQKQILTDYRRDFSKHAPTREVPRINMIWDSIPAQLARESKKFVYGAVKKSARAAEFELALQWLMDAGLTYKVTRVNAPRLPIKFYEDLNTFKLFMLDVGLMGAMTDTPAEAVLVGEQIFSEYKGAFTELYVLTQLKAAGMTLFYHSVERSTIEIDFLMQKENSVIPIEVKAEVNVKAKSLKNFLQNNPELHALRFSMLPFQEQERLTNIPLYACNAFSLQIKP
ncbi:MAG: ATP-binding protein [Alloprevotella sp.]